MRYFSLFGNHPDLSFLELCSVLESENISYTIESFSNSVCLWECAQEIPLVYFQKRLGGTVKFGLLYDQTFEYKKDSLAQVLTDLLLPMQEYSKRLTFGLSLYVRNDEKKESFRSFRKNQSFLKSLGLDIKKSLIQNGGSIRFVFPQQTLGLSSVVVEKNNLTKSGNTELVLFKNTSEVLLGKTLFVQPFEEYSFRDWSRPHHDMSTGLLPPKLAQIMINLTGLSPKNQPHLHDPFCGFGTLLQEALLMGYEHVGGSDIDPIRVEETRANIAWLCSKHSCSLSPQRIFESPAGKLGVLFAPESLDAFITEPYLGPILPKHQKPPLQLVRELSHLYFQSFKAFYTLLKKGGVVVCVLPVWRSQKNTPLAVFDRILSLGFKNTTIPSHLLKYIHQPTNRKTLLYTRVDQTIARELCVFKKC